MSDVTHLPTPGVVLDLDAYERPASDIKPPFTVKVGDRVLTFNDPDEWDWRETVAISTPGDMLRSALSPEDLDFLKGLKLKAFQFAKLLADYSEHYGLREKFEEARRQQAFGGL